MSLETTLQRNNELLEQLISALTALPLTEKEKAPVAKASPKKTTAKKEVAIEEKTTTVEKPEPVPASEEIAHPTYDETAEYVVKVSREKSSLVARSILENFGASKLTGIPPEKFNVVIDACKKALEA